MQFNPTGIFAIRILTGTLCGALLLLGASTAQAGDGRIELNQARALAGGISPTDTPGFPISLEANRSYVLTGDLDAGGASGISATGGSPSRDNITVDLNGFSLRGNGSGSTVGVNLTGENFEIKNGTIRDFGLWGLLLQTSGRHVVRNLRVIENGTVGIQSNGAAMVTGCFVESNGSHGITAGGNSYVVGNRVVNNGGIGILLSGGSFAEGNLIRQTTTTDPALNASTLTGGNSSGYRNNVIGNGGPGGTVVGGNDMGGNLCNGSTSCP